jgi:DNA-binding IclR family transcriptional regulator
MSEDPNTKPAPTPRRHKPEQERHFVTALARGLEVLRCFQPEEPLLGNQEIARRVGLPKSTVSRLTGTLTSLGYLRWVPSPGKYELGAAMRAFGSPQLASANLRRLARPLMQALADHGRMSVSMGVQDRTSMIYVENCRSVAAISLSVEVGVRIPMATTAMGRAFVCSAPEAEREALLAQLQREHGADWPRLKAGLERAIQGFQRTGYCVSLGEWYEDVHAVAVPLMQVDGSQSVVFSIGGPAYQLGQPLIERDIGPRLVQLVRNLEAQLKN